MRRIALQALFLAAAAASVGCGTRRAPTFRPRAPEPPDAESHARVREEERLSDRDRWVLRDIASWARARLTGKVGAYGVVSSAEAKAALYDLARKLQRSSSEELRWDAVELFPSVHALGLSVAVWHLSIGLVPADEALGGERVMDPELITRFADALDAADIRAAKSAYAAITAQSPLVPDGGM